MEKFELKKNNILRICDSNGKLLQELLIVQIGVVVIAQDLISNEQYILRK